MGPPASPMLRGCEGRITRILDRSMSFLEGPALGWFALAVVAAIVEVVLPHFGLIFAAIGAVGGAVAAAAGLSLPFQIVVFAIVLTLSLFLLRPRLMRLRSAAPGVPSRTEQLTGKDGIVTQDIDPLVGTGRVNIGGEDWAARSADAIPTGTRVRVAGADGIVLEVRRS